MTIQRRDRVTWLAFALACAACEQDASERASPATAPAAASAHVESASPPQLPRATDERYMAAVRAFEAHAWSEAQQAWLAAPESLDAALLGARLRAREGDSIAAVRAIEAARAAHPDQARVYATAAEIHALAGRSESAEEEIRNGLALAGPTPEMSRARGVLALGREGGARVALEHLLAARAADASLEFCAEPTARAHVLLARAALANKDGPDAVVHARAALALVPNDADARRTLADALAGIGQFDEAIALHEALLAEGLGSASDASWIVLHGATAALLEKKRELAVERYLRACELGLPREELGFGATILAEESAREVERGLAAYDGDDLAQARAAFERALVLEPGSIEARNHLAVVLFRAGEFAAAAEHWSRVIELARAGSIELPEPVHLNLARALHQAGRQAEIRVVLDDYLASWPDGEWADATRDMLAKLELEARER